MVWVATAEVADPTPSVAAVAAARNVSPQRQRCPAIEILLATRASPQRSHRLRVVTGRGICPVLRLSVPPLHPTCVPAPRPFARQSTEPTTRCPVRQPVGPGNPGTTSATPSQRWISQPPATLSCAETRVPRTAPFTPACCGPNASVVQVVPAAVAPNG